MNYTEMPELPPIEAYEGDGYVAHNELHQNETSEEVRHGDAPLPDSPLFGSDGSPFWQISDASDWVEAALERRQWLVPQYLMKRKVTGLIGAPEAGKSGLALKWGISLALNIPFGDFAPVPLPSEMPRARRVVILNAEDDEDEQRRRISSMMRDTGRPVSALRDNLVRIGPKGDTARLFEPAPDTGDVCTTQGFEDLSRFLKERAVDVLILDPLVELMGGLDENSNAIMGQVFARLRSMAEDCGIAIVVIHHTRKGVTVPGNLEAARGGGALGGSIRIGLTLAVMTETEAGELGLPIETRKHYVRLDNAKQSYGPPSDKAAWFQRLSVILDNGDSAPSLEPWSPPKAREMSLEDLAPIEATIKAGIGGEPYSPKLSSNDRSIRRALGEHGFTGNATEAAVIRALRDKCGMAEADYHRRNDRGQKRGAGRGLRIGGLPAVEWITYPGSTGSPTSGSDDDED